MDVHNWYMNGLCYLVPQPDIDGTVKPLPLLFNHTRAFIRLHKPTNHSVPDFMVGGLGISAHYTKKVYIDA